MAQVSTATTNFDKHVQVMINTALEQELRGNLPHLDEGGVFRARLVKGTNGTLRFLRVADLSVTTNSDTVSAGTAPWLTQGTKPTAETLTLSYEELTAYQAGRVVDVTDVALDEHPADFLAIAAERVARNAAATADMYAAGLWLAGTNALYAGTGNTQTSEVAAGDVVTATLLRRAVATLRSDDVPAFGDGFYRAIVHPGVVFDIETDTAAGGWIDASRYAGSMPLITGEIGRFAGIRFIVSSNARIKTAQGTSSIDVYSTLAFGPGFAAWGDLQSVQGYITPPGGKGDELHQKASAGWKGMFGGALLDDGGNRYVRIESATAL